MNELYKQLAEQAAQTANETPNSVALEVTADDITYQVPANFIEALTELIVRECSTLAYDGPGGILEHFGVEE